MKKTKIALCAMLALAVAFACFAFAGCGDEITASTPATEESFTSFAETAALKSAEDAETGMPGFISGNGYKVEMDMTMSTEQTMSGGSVSAKTTTEMTYKADGQLNMVKDMTGTMNVDMDFSMQTTGSSETESGNSAVSVSIEGDSVIADGIMYVDGSCTVSGGSTTADTSTKVAMSAESVTNNLGTIVEMIPNGEISLSDYVKQLNIVYGDGEDDDAVSVYIDGNSMRIEIDGVGYIGIMYDDEGVLTAGDVVFDNYTVTSGGSSSAYSTTMTTSITYKIRKTDVSTVTAPADAADYEMIEL